MKMVNQSKPFPCAPDNEIMVGLKLNVPLLASCKHADVNVFNVTPTVSIIGLTGTHTAVPSLALTGNAPFAGLAASWNKGSGTISMTPSAETVAGQVYYFSFTVWNQYNSQAAPTLTMRTDTILNTAGDVPVVTPDAYAPEVLAASTWASAHHSSGTFLAEEEVKAMFLRKPNITHETVLVQSSPYPCDLNTVSIHTFCM